MNWTEIAANWPAVTGRVLTRWPEADETEVLALDGDHDAFVAYVSRLEAIPVAEAQDRVAAWAETAMPADAWMDPTHDAAAIAASAAELPPGEEPLDADEAFGDESVDGRTVPAPPVSRSP